MTIEFIDSRNSFFEDVKALGRKNSATLGFMPEGGFEDHARNKCIIIAHDGYPYHDEHISEWADHPRHSPFL